MRALSQLLSLQWHVQEIRKWLSTCQMNPFCCVTSFSDSWSTSCSSWTLPAHPAAPAPTGEILAPFPAYSICFAKAGEQSPTPPARLGGFVAPEQAALLIGELGLMHLVCLKYNGFSVSASPAPPSPMTFSDYILEVSPAHLVLENGSWVLGLEGDWEYWGGREKFHQQSLRGREERGR